MPTVSIGFFRWLFHSGARLEDFADKLNHVWTFGLLLILGILISWKYGYEEPVTCWLPSEFSRSQIDYVHKSCWHGNFLYIIDTEVLLDLRTRIHYPSYHERIPLIICLQALLFQLPTTISYILHEFSGTDLHEVAGLTEGFQYLNLSERTNLANQIARYIYRWCKTFPRGLPWRNLTLVWFLVKCLYCLNIVFQFIYLNQFLRTTDVPVSFGNSIYENLKPNATEWKMSPVFPQTLLCDINIRQLRYNQLYTMQCDFHVNRFTERVYMFLWLWLLFVLVITTLSLVVWTLFTLLPFPRQRYIRRFLELSEENPVVSDHDVSVLTSVVGEDGVMVLKLVSANSTELLVRDVVCCLSRIVRGCSASTSSQSGQAFVPSSSLQHAIAPTVALETPQGIYHELPKPDP